MIFHLLFQRMRGRRLLQHRGSDVLQRQTPGSFLFKKKKKKRTQFHGSSEPGHTLVEALGGITHAAWDRL